MRIGMIALMVVGMIALNGCGVDTKFERDIISKNIVRSQYPNGTITSLSQFHYMVIVPGKVILVECMSSKSDSITDSSVYEVPSKCQ